MSKASERKAMGDTLSAYPLMTVRELADFLRCSPDHAAGLCKDGEIRAANIAHGVKRAGYRVDPVDAAVYVLAKRDGVTPRDFWNIHGPEGTPELCLRLIRRIRKIQAAA